MDEDKHLRGLKALPFNREFPVLPSGQGLFVIRGPRQIGKSSWMKKMLSQVNPRESFYISCEEIANFKELSEVLRMNADRKIYFIDEISFVDQWWRSIKSLLDSRDDVRVIVTGSHSHPVNPFIPNILC